MVDAVIYKVKKAQCPTCSHPLDAATPMDDADQRAPESGDLTICVKCATVLTYDDNMDLQSMTDQDIRQLEPSLAHEVLNHQKAVRYYAGVAAAREALLEAAKDITL